MAKNSKYGHMPEIGSYTAKVKGDAGTYPVRGFNWLERTILIERAGYEWISVAKIALTKIKPEPENHSS